jgi:hypothetical protein
MRKPDYRADIGRICETCTYAAIIAVPFADLITPQCQDPALEIAPARFSQASSLFEWRIVLRRTWLELYEFNNTD